MAYVSGATVVRPGMGNLGAGSLTVVTRGVTQPTFTYHPATTPANPQVIRVAGEYYHPAITPPNPQVIRVAGKEIGRD